MFPGSIPTPWGRCCAPSSYRLVGRYEACGKLIPETSDRGSIIWEDVLLALPDSECRCSLEVHLSRLETDEYQENPPQSRGAVTRVSFPHLRLHKGHVKREPFMTQRIS